MAYTSRGVLAAWAESHIPPYVSTATLAGVLGISRPTVRKCASLGHLRAVSRGVYSREAVAEWLRSHPRYAVRALERDFYGEAGACVDGETVGKG